MSSGAVLCTGRRFDIAKLEGDRTNKRLFEHMTGRGDHAGKEDQNDSDNSQNVGQIASA